MEQVRELLRLIRRRSVDGVIVTMNFIFQWVLPCKERAHPGYEFQGDTDGTQDVLEEIDQDEVKRQISMLFNLMGRLSIRDQRRAFSIESLPPAVRVLLWCLLGRCC